MYQDGDDVLVLEGDKIIFFYKKFFHDDVNIFELRYFNFGRTFWHKVAGLYWRW
jgi:hypothetical protein